MTVGVAQHRINEMKGIVDKLANCLEKMRYEEDRSKIDVLKENYGITPDLIHEAAQFLNITAKNFQEDLDNCDVNCQCW